MGVPPIPPGFEPVESQRRRDPWDVLRAEGFEPTNGYRAPGDIERIRRQGYRPATNSHHNRGDAVDGRFPGLSPAEQERRARELFGDWPGSEIDFHDGHLHLGLPGWGAAPGTPGTPNSGLPVIPAGFDLHQRGSLASGNFVNAPTAPPPVSGSPGPIENVINSSLAAVSEARSAVPAPRDNWNPNEVPTSPVYTGNPDRQAVQVNSPVPEGMAVSFPQDAAQEIFNYMRNSGSDRYEDVAAYASQVMGRLYGYEDYQLGERSPRAFREWLASHEDPRQRPMPRFAPLEYGPDGNRLTGPLVPLAERERQLKDFLGRHEASSRDLDEMSISERIGNRFGDLFEAAGAGRSRGRAAGQSLIQDWTGLQWLEDGERALGRGNPTGLAMIGVGALDLAGLGSSGRKLASEMAERLGDAANRASPERLRFLEAEYSGPRQYERTREENDALFGLVEQERAALREAPPTHSPDVRTNMPSPAERAFGPSSDDIPPPPPGFEIVDEPPLGRVPRLSEQATPEELARAARGIAPEDVVPIPANRVETPDELPSSIAPMEPPEVGRRPRQPDRFSRSLQAFLSEESKRKGVTVRIDAEEAIDKGVPADLIYHNPGVTDRSKLRLRNPRLFGTRFGRMSSRQQELRSLDMDNIDPAEWGFENAAGRRLAPEEAADLLRRDLEGDPSALARGPAFDELMDYEARAASRAEFEGRFPDGPPVERVGEPVGAEDLDSLIPPATAYEDLPNVGGRVGNINLEHVETRNDIRRLLKNVESRFGGFDAARRSRISQAETRALANEMGMTADDLLQRRKGQALNAEQALAARQLLAKSSDEITNLAQRIGPGASDEDRATFAKSLLRHAAIHEQVTGATAEAGRALSQFKMAARSRAIGQRIHETIIQGVGGPNRLEDVAGAILDLQRRGAGPAQINRLAANATKPQFRDKLVELWYNSLLSGPQTHVVNTLSNALTATLQIPEQALASAMGQVRRGVRRLRGKEDDFDRVLASELGPRMVGLMQGSQEGLRAFGRTLKTGEVPDFVTKVESRSQRAISGVKGEVIRVPSRLLAAEDEFFKAIGRRMELNGLAVRQARREGLRGQAARDRIAELAERPTDEMLERSLDYARYLTFQRPLTGFPQDVSRLTQRQRWLKLIIPFVRTPTNILKFAVARSPLAPLLKEVRAELRAGGEKRHVAMARIMLGTGFAATVTHWADQGIITGGGPADPAARDMMIADGWQPYSIRIGDRYYSYARLDPLSTTLGTAADLVDFSRHMTDSQSEQQAALLIASIMRNLSNKTWLSGATDALAVIDDPQRNLTGFASRLAGSVAVPTGVNQLAQAIDPVERDTRGDNPVDSALRRIQSRIPGLSDNLPARQDVWGREMRREGGVGPDIASPFRTRTARNDPITAELLAIGANIGRPSRRLQGRKLSQAEYASYQETSSRYIRDDLQAAMSDPEWPAATVEERVEWVNDIKRDAREDARVDLGLDGGERRHGRAPADLPPVPPGFELIQ